MINNASNTLMQSTLMRVLWAEVAEKAQQLREPYFGSCQAHTTESSTSSIFGICFRLSPSFPIKMIVVTRLLERRAYVHVAQPAFDDLILLRARKKTDGAY